MASYRVTPRSLAAWSGLLAIAVIMSILSLEPRDKTLFPENVLCNLLLSSLLC